jgi:uncharacterized protein
MKMLCLDGGGIRGVFEIMILDALEKECKRPIGDLFDVIAGTSTGSIIAASIAINNDMSWLLENYCTYGKKIFERQAKLGFFKSVYDDQSLRHLLQEAFGEVTLDDIKKPLLIPAVDITHGNPFILRSNYGNPESKDLSIKLWDAVLSSCSAPVYFPPNNVNDKFLSIDGGLWANNPSMVCITEGLHFFDLNLKDIHIVSIGTGKQNIEFTNTRDQSWGIKKWLPFQVPNLKITPKLIDLALNLSSESVSYHCQLLLKDHYLRINEELGEEVPFDEVNSIEMLMELGTKVYKDRRDELLSFLEK